MTSLPERGGGAETALGYGTGSREASEAAPSGSHGEGLDGRYIMGILGCDLAADPINRQAALGDIRKNAKLGLKCERPALLIVAVEPGREDEAGRRIGDALGGFREGERP